MKKCWSVLPPPLADSFGFLEVIRQTDGIGLLDDCGAYRMAEGRHDGPDVRTTCSEAGEEDIVGGTREKVMEAFRRFQAQRNGRFALLGFGPCAAMIGTDHEEIAGTLMRECAIPVGTVRVTGQKNYDVGISETLLALIRLLTDSENRPESIPGSVNLLGGTALDLGEENASEVRSLFTSWGCQVIAAPGRTVSGQQIAQMGSAGLNVVLTVSGLAAARLLQERYGTPYMVVSPFGADTKNRLRNWMDSNAGDGMKEQSPMPSGQRDIVFAGESAAPLKTEMSGMPISDDQIWILHEQVTANAIRQSLVHRFGWNEVHVGSLYQMDRSLMKEGDRKVPYEDDVRTLLAGLPAGTIVIGDPAIARLAPESVRWVPLPHRAMHQYDVCAPMPTLLGDRLESWLSMQGLVSRQKKR